MTSHSFQLHYEEIGVVWKLSTFFMEQLPFDSPSLTFCCIGSDRSTGDTLGPLIGTWLADHSSFPFEVIGTLTKPLHALNLQETLDSLQHHKPDAFLVAIDACLGQVDRIGYIVANEGPLFPGKAVKKELPPIGHFSIKGIINVCGFMEFAVLQNTRLQVPYEMGQIIYRSILLAWQRHKLKLVRDRYNDSDNYHSWQQISDTNLRQTNHV